MSRAPASDRFLDDPVVVEIGHRIGVGACGSLLAQLGARVFVVEPATPIAHGKWRNRAAMLAGKQSVVAGAAATDAALLRDLVASADVVLLSTDDGASEPGAWDAPRPSTQVVCDFTAFGHEGPLAGRGGAEPIVAALSGVVDTTGPADGPPLSIGAPVLEMSAAVFAAASVIAALRVRRLHGSGQRIDIALYDTAINELANFLPLHFEGQVATRSGNRHPLHVPWGTYRTSDGHVVICASGDDQFARVCDAIGMPALATDERYATPTARRARYGEIDRHIEAWTSTRTLAQCEEALGESGVACGSMVPVDALPIEPNLAHRKSIVTLPDPLSARDVPVPGSPIRGLPIGGRCPTSIPRPDSGRGDAEAIVRSRASRGPESLATGDPAIGLRPLSGVRVVEIGQHTVAPLASRHLGALGADVIKVESPGGDAIRNAAPLRSDGLSHIFAISNTDKRGVVLDLRSPSHREVLRAMLASADILVENMRPGALARLGFDAGRLRAEFPRLVYCPINGFGTASAYPGRRAMDTVIQAMSGLMSLTTADGRPMKAGISVSDMMGGEMGLLACLAALECRDRTGVAVHFDLAMQDSSAWMTQIAWQGSLAAEPVAVRAASDGYVLAMATRERMDEALGTGAWKGDRESLARALRAAGIDSVPVLTVHEVADSAQVAARKLVIEVEAPDGAAWRVLGSPLRLRSTPAVVGCAMPRLGVGSDAIVREFSGATASPRDATMPFT